MKRPSPKTFAELKTRNYTIYLSHSRNIDFRGFLTDLIEEQRRFVVKSHLNIFIPFECSKFVFSRPNIKDEDMENVAYNIFERMHTDSSLKAVIPATEADLKIIRSAFLVPHILEETISFYPKSICTQQRSYIFAKANKKTFNDLISGGIIQYWYSYLLDYEMKAIFEEPKGPKVFSVVS